MRRTLRDIYKEMLTICLKKTLKTHIMYRTNLSFQQADEYTKRLIAKGLLKLSFSEKHSRLFLTTTRGKKWLKTFKILKTLEEVIMYEQE